MVSLKKCRLTDEHFCDCFVHGKSFVANIFPPEHKARDDFQHQAFFPEVVLRRLALEY